MKKYWNMMTQKKYDCLGLAHQLRNYILIERSINIILAIVSTGSLAGLFIDERWRFFLSIILALTQIITAAKPYLPYQERCKELEKGLFLFENLYLEIENQWYILSDNNSSDIDYIKSAYEYEKKWKNIQSEALKGDMVDISSKNKELAENERNDYFKNF